MADNWYEFKKYVVSLDREKKFSGGNDILKVESFYPTEFYNACGASLYFSDINRSVSVYSPDNIVSSYIGILYSIDIFDFDPLVTVIRSGCTIDIAVERYRTVFDSLMSRDGAVHIIYSNEISYEYNKHSIIFEISNNYPDYYFYESELKRRIRMETDANS